jgi:hypothetical protein
MLTRGRLHTLGWCAHHLPAESSLTALCSEPWQRRRYRRLRSLGSVADVPQSFAELGLFHHHLGFAVDTSGNLVFVEQLQEKKSPRSSLVYKLVIVVLWNFISSPARYNSLDRSAVPRPEYLVDEGWCYPDILFRLGVWFLMSKIAVNPVALKKFSLPALDLFRGSHPAPSALDRYGVDVSNGE